MRCEVKHELRSHAAAPRGVAPHPSMFLRMLVRAAVLRRGRAASALLAMVVAAAAATAMLNLYVDVQAKLNMNFATTERILWSRRRMDRSFLATLCRTVRIDSRQYAASQFHLRYVVARTSDGQLGGRCRNRFRSSAQAGSLVVGQSAGPRLQATLWSARRARRCQPTASGKTVRSQLSGTHASPESGRHFANRGRRGQPHLSFARRFRQPGRGVPYFDDRNCRCGLVRRKSALPCSSSHRLFRTPRFARLDRSWKAKRGCWARCGARFWWPALLIILTAAVCVLATLTGWVFPIGVVILPS